MYNYQRVIVAFNAVVTKWTIDRFRVTALTENYAGEIWHGTCQDAVSILLIFLINRAESVSYRGSAKLICRSYVLMFRSGDFSIPR